MLATDPEARIKAWAKCLYDKGEDPEVEFPMLTKVYDNGRGGELWMGGAGIWPKQPHHLPDDFDYVFQLTKREFFDLGPNTRRTVVTMGDTARQTFEAVPELAAKVAALVRAGKKVLVHCQAGMNRSGLVTAVALICLGYSPFTAIAELRELRGPEVLCNPNFENYVRSFNAQCL